MGCGRATMKSLLICFNVVFCVFAVIIIVAGAILHSLEKPPDSPDTTGSPVSTDSPDAGNPADAIDVFKVIGIFLIIVGCIAFFISLLGCCGAAHENKCMLMTYAVLIFIIMMCDVILATVSIINRYQLNDDDKKPDEGNNDGTKIISFGIVTYCSALFNIMQIIFACALAKKTHR
ncbi:hypothetical protein B566_EDAN010550 [Ephemera danica]|nr:hypothetical protein B566_EDAN010550 [Ephemera danica]